MKSVHRVAAALILFSAAGSAAAETQFSNVVVGGDLSIPNVVDTRGDRLDLSLSNAFVGDVVAPRSGNVTITYDAQRLDGTYDVMFVNLLGALSGSGQINVSVLVQDISGPQPVQIGAFQTLLNNNASLPMVTRIDLSQVTPRIRVNKTLALSAPLSPAEDLANVSLVSDTLALVPEPASLILLATAGLFARRRGR